MKRNKKLIALIKECKGKIMKFRDLPSTAKSAIAHYMSIDGEAWKFPEYLKNHRSENTGLYIRKHLGFYTKLYGNKKFGLVNIPTEQLLAFFCNGVYSC